MADGFPDSGNPDDYSEEQLQQLSEMDKGDLTKNQKAAVARWKFKKSPAAKKRAEKSEGGSDAKMQGTATAEEEKPEEDPEVQKRRDQALTFPYVKELKDELGDAVVVDTTMQLTKPYVVVKPREVPRLMRYAKDVLGFDGLLCLTAADYPPERIEVVYNLYHYGKKQHLAVKATVPREGEGCAVPSITDIYAGANWLEREVLDMFGVQFPNHPYPKRLLLPEGWVGYPLRKDYDLLQTQYVGMDDEGEDIVSFNAEEGW